jgi:hypothetical protein
LRPKLGVDYTIRAAHDFEGPVIQDLYKDTLVATINWDAPLDASWVLAVHPTKPYYYGVLSLVAGKPIGRLEMLRIRDGLPNRLRACIVRDLIHYSLLVLKQYGCQAVTASAETPTFGKVIERHFGGQPVAAFTGYLKRF